MREQVVLSDLSRTSELFNRSELRILNWDLRSWQANHIGCGIQYCDSGPTGVPSLLKCPAHAILVSLPAKLARRLCAIFWMHVAPPLFIPCKMSPRLQIQPWIVHVALQLVVYAFACSDTTLPTHMHGPGCPESGHSAPFSRCWHGARHIAS